MREAIDWVESNSILTGTILDNGPSLQQIEEEILNIPVEVPSLKSPSKTEKVVLIFPEHFAADRKESVAEKIKEIYPLWKVEASSDKLEIIPEEEPSQQL